VYESLRRLENGQADIFAGQEDIFAAIKAMDIPTIEAIKAELRRGNEGLLTNELRRRAPSKRVTEQDIDVAKTYVTASPPERANIEHRSRTRSSTTQHRNGRENSESRNATGGYSYEPYDSTGHYDAPEYHEQPPRFDPARPTYIKAHRKYLDPRTLDAYSLPWEWDHVSNSLPPPLLFSLAHHLPTYLPIPPYRPTQTTSSSKHGSPSPCKRNSSSTPRSSAKGTSSKTA